MQLGGRLEPVWVKAGMRVPDQCEVFEFDKYQLSTLPVKSLKSLMDEMCVYYDKKDAKEELLNRLSSGWEQGCANMRSSMRFYRTTKPKEVQTDMTSEGMDQMIGLLDYMTGNQKDKKSETDQSEENKSIQEELNEENPEEEEPTDDEIVEFKSFIKIIADKAPPLVFSVDVETTGVFHLLQLMADQGVPSDQLSLFYNGKKTEYYNKLSYYTGVPVNEHIVFTFEARVKGLKGGVVQLHLKKNEMLENLKKKATINVAKKEQVNIPDFATQPAGLKAIKDEMVNAVGNVKLLKTQGFQIVKTGLRNASDTELAEIMELSKYQNSSGHVGAEGRVVRIIGVLFPSLVNLMEMKCKMQELEDYMTVEMVKMFCDEYHQRRGNSAVIDMGSFRGHLKSEIERRRDEANRARLANANSEQSDNGQNNSCVIV